MAAKIVAFETRAGREERLYRESEAPFATHFAERSRATHAALVEAMRHWNVAQIDLRDRASGKQAASVPDTAA